MRYSFFCNRCEKPFDLNFSIEDSKGREEAKCPECGSPLERVFSAPLLIQKAPRIERKRVGNFNSGDVNYGFKNHGAGHGLSPGSIGNSIPGTRVDEKSGRLVVDVVSSVPDPLGKISESRKEPLQKLVNQKYKKRKK